MSQNISNVLTNRIQGFIELIIRKSPNSTVCLVGSYSSGKATKGSDIDIVVFVEKTDHCN
ncbi:MAG: nucleotidyltransferase domain-containing protein [Candidatus Hodarchaeales archaeon]